MGAEDSQDEGRIITLEYKNFYLVNVYTPNAQRDLARLPLRLQWEDRLASYLQELNSQKPVVYCGDLNVAHTEIDLKMQNLILEIRALHMKREQNFQRYWKAVL